jgi:hypothetical protein
MICLPCLSHQARSSLPRLFSVTDEYCVLLGSGDGLAPTDRIPSDDNTWRGSQVIPPGPDVQMPGVAVEAAAYAVPLLRNGRLAAMGRWYGVPSHQQSCAGWVLARADSAIFR